MNDIRIKHLGLIDYQTAFDQMRDFTENRTPDTPDEIWVCEHPPVFTQGKHGKAKHILTTKLPSPITGKKVEREGNIPIIQTDRGGQVTYHGPGQLIVYFLIDLKRRKLGIKHLVTRIEQSVLSLLAELNIKNGHLTDGAPGIYIDHKKIASLGLRVKHGMTYHGLAFNIDMDLTPFSYINPCGYQGLQMTQLKTFQSDIDVATAAKLFLDHFPR